MSVRSPNCHFLPVEAVNFSPTSRGATTDEATKLVVTEISNSCVRASKSGSPAVDGQVVLGV